MEYNLDLNINDVRLRAWKLQLLLEQDTWDAQTRAKASLVMGLCASDAERLLLLDWMDSSRLLAQGLFIDDIRTRFSSPAAALVGISCLSSYASAAGVVFECGDVTKCCVIVDGMVASSLHAFKNKLRGTLQGDTPCVASQSKFLGVADGPSDVDDGLIFAQVIARGAVASAGACQISAQLHWPMIARYFFLQQAVSTLDYLLP